MDWTSRCERTHISKQVETSNKQDDININCSPPPVLLNLVYLEPIFADASVEQHNVRPQSSERQHIRSAGGDPERTAGVFSAQAGTRKADAPGSITPPSGTQEKKG